MTRFLLQVALVCLVFIAAWRAGGRPERLVASIYLAMLAVGSLHAVAFGPFDQGGYKSFYGFRAALDGAALLAVVFVALRYDRWWTLWVGSVQLIAVIAHILRLIEMPIPLLAFDIMERWPVWMAVLITGVGTFLHARQPRASVTVT